MTLYPIRGVPACVPEVMLLFEAIQARQLVVHETGRVGRLELEVTGPRPVFGLGGHMLLGGRQDRVLRHDVVAVPQAGHTSARAFCVEEARWSRRRGASARCFEASGALIPASMRTLLMTGASQEQVWEGVTSTQADLGCTFGGPPVRDARSCTSLPLTLAQWSVGDRVAELVEPLLEQLRDVQDVVGHVIVGADGPRSVQAEWFASPYLYGRLHRRLLESCATTALISGTEDGPPPDPQEIAKWLEWALRAPSAKASPAGAAWCTTRVDEGVVIQETVWGAAQVEPLHVVAAGEL